MKEAPAEGVSLRRDFLATARAALAEKRRPVPKAAPSVAVDADDFVSTPDLDPYRGIGAWR